MFWMELSGLLLLVLKLDYQCLVTCDTFQCGQDTKTQGKFTIFLSSDPFLIRHNGILNHSPSHRPSPQKTVSCSSHPNLTPFLSCYSSTVPVVVSSEVPAQSIQMDCPLLQRLAVLFSPLSALGFLFLRFPSPLVNEVQWPGHSLRACLLATPFCQ